MRVRTMRSCVELLISEVFKHTQHVQRNRSGRSHDARALAVGADDSRAFENAGADSLTRHFEQAKVRNAADLDAGAVIFQRVLDAPLDRPIVPRFLHVNKVDHDKPGEVAQTQLTRDFVGGLKVGAERSVFDIVLTRGSTRIDIDRDQSLGLVDNDVAARLQRNLIGEHRVELRFRRQPWRRPAACRDRVARC